MQEKGSKALSRDAINKINSAQIKRQSRTTKEITDITRIDMALSAISMNSALADKEFVLSLHHKLHVSTCINKPNDVHKHNYSLNQSIIFT